MKGPLISVIVPIYKAENYIDKCITSILNQTYQSLEVILVDDGSPDRCPGICNKYAKVDDRIRVIHKENGGQASARNMALDIASGEYIGFVDADDWADEKMFETLYTSIEEKNADVAICNFALVDEDGAIRYWDNNFDAVDDYDNGSLMKALLKNRKINEMFWNKLFRREVISTERFIEGMIFEDTEMMHRCLGNAKSCVYTGKPLYYNFMSIGSTTRSVMNPKRFDRAQANINRIKYYEENYPEYLIEANTAYIDVCLDLINESTGNENCATFRSKTIREIKEFLKDNCVKDSKKAKLARMGSKMPSPMFYCFVRFPYWLYGIKNRLVKK